MPQKTGFEISPELMASYNANKHLSFEASGNRFGGEVTAKYNF